MQRRAHQPIPRINTEEPSLFSNLGWKASISSVKSFTSAKTISGGKCSSCGTARTASLFLGCTSFSLSLSLSVCVCVSECLHVCLHRCRQCKHTAICCSSPLQLGPHLRVSVSLRCCMRTFNVSDPTDASRVRTSNVYSLTLPYFVCNCISPDRVMKHR